MELGSWALIQSPSLIALVPLLVYLVLVFAGKNNLVGIVAGIIVGCVLTGQDLKMTASALQSSLGSFTALIGLIIMVGAGLGVLMTETRVTHTMVYWIVKGINVNTQAKAKVALIICSIIVCGLLGTLGGGNAVIAPIIIPIMASLGVTPSVVATLFKTAGEIGLIVGPLTGVTLITMELCGLSYGQLMIGAALPFSIVWLTATWFATKRMQRRTEGLESYAAEDGIKDFDSIVITAKEKTTTIAFLAAFVALVGYGIVSKQGTNYALVVMLLLIGVVTLVSRTNVEEALDHVIKGIATQAGMFVVFIGFDMLINIVTVGGGFDSLSALLSGLAGDSASAVMLIASLVGGFGIEAAAVAEIKIIFEMFGTAAVATGLPMSMFAISILAATRLTGSFYPGTNLMGQLGTARSDNMKEVLQGMWISGACVWVFIFIWAFIAPSFMPF